MGGQVPDPINGVYMGGWGNFGCPTPQKGIATYTLSPNRQRPLAGALYNAVFNTWRRSKAQILYVVPPLIAAYAVMEWADERNAYLNSKPGRLAEGGSSEE